MSGIASLFRRSSHKDTTTSGTSLPVHKHDNNGDPYRCADTSTGANNTPASISTVVSFARPQHHFLLLCLPFMRWGTKLFQSEVCRVNSDRDFFRLLGERYHTARAARKRGPFSWLLRPRSIEFVKVRPMF